MAKGLFTHLLVWCVLYVDENSCDPRAYCPPQCKCSGTEVRCSHEQLSALPELLPLDTTELYVSSRHSTYTYTFTPASLRDPVVSRHCLSSRTERRAVSLHTRHWLAMRSAVFVVSLEHSVLHIDRQSTLSLLLARLKSIDCWRRSVLVCSLSRKRKHGCAPAFYRSINSSYYYCFHYCLILLSSV